MGSERVGRSVRRDWQEEGREADLTGRSAGDWWVTQSGGMGS